MYAIYAVLCTPLAGRLALPAHNMVLASASEYFKVRLLRWSEARAQEGEGDRAAAAAAAAAEEEEAAAARKRETRSLAKRRQQQQLQQQQQQQSRSQAAGEPSTAPTPPPAGALAATSAGTHSSTAELVEHCGPGELAAAEAVLRAMYTAQLLDEEEGDADLLIKV